MSAALAITPEEARAQRVADVQDVLRRAWRAIWSAGCTADPKAPHPIDAVAVDFIRGNGCLLEVTTSAADWVARETVHRTERQKPTEQEKRP